MATNERRRHVRLKPTPELPVHVALANGGILREALDVLDLSISGLAVSAAALGKATTGDRLRLHITLGAAPEIVVDAQVRWRSGDAAGLELVDPPQRAAQELGKYLAELLERGGSA
jgi:PilZ domain